MRGLDVAIVDEIDSVLIDDAGTPLMISMLTSGRTDEAIVEKASEIAAEHHAHVGNQRGHVVFPPSTRDHGRHLRKRSARLGGIDE